MLDKLKHQQDAPDQELLDRLGWSEQELRDFLSRWDKMKQAASQPKPPSPEQVKAEAERHRRARARR